MADTPSRADFRDQALSDVAMAVMQDPNEFKAGSVFPVTHVSAISGFYYKVDRAEMMRAGAAPRASNQQLPEILWTLSDDSYICKEWGDKIKISNRDLQDVRMARILETGSTEAVTRAALLRFEVNWTLANFVTGVWATTVDLSVTGPQWSSYTDSTPELILDDAKLSIALAGGKKPNTLVLGYRVAMRLRRHPRILDMFRGVNGSAGTVTDQELALALGIERVVVLEAMRTTSAQGAATATYDFVQGNHALLCFVDPSPNPMAQTAGRTFMLNRSDRGNLSDDGMSVDVYRYQEVPTNSTVIECSFDLAHKVVDNTLGYLFLNAAA